MTNKPQLAFVGRIAGLLLCECGTEMRILTYNPKKDNYAYECTNTKCSHHGKLYVAVISNAVLFYFYEVKKT